MSNSHTIAVSRSAPAMTEGGRKLRAHRTSLKQTMDEFGERYELSRSVIQRLETGHLAPDIAQAVRFKDDGICEVEDWARPACESADG